MQWMLMIVYLKQIIHLNRIIIIIIRYKKS